ncbi:MAG: NADH-ubiquinone oxidoreductase-F iron-sulfur binding region domain-containing protein [Campylobacterota bacterium]
MIHTHDDLEIIRDTKRQKECQKPQKIHVCTGSSCQSLGASEIYDRLKQRISQSDKADCCEVKGVGCNGLCSAGVLVTHRRQDHATLYQSVDEQNVTALAEDLAQGRENKELLCDTDDPFFTRQTKIVLENAGRIDPDDIEDYIAHGGYEALLDMLQEKQPEEVLGTIKQSGLRGRGGGGFPTGLKWESVAKVESTQKYIICNGDEGDPGAFMDRAIMEADPHRIIEGMAIAGYAVGANKGYIYVRAEYPLAVQKLKKAIKQANRLGLLGNKICDSGFDFELEVRLGGGAFVCGEATALVTSIEGNRGNPRQKPPHLSDHGLHGNPTVLNNVETLANIVPIIKNGPAWFKSFGTQGSAGTKVFALTGHIRHTGLVEVPMGMSLEEVINQVGGGVDEGSLKAIQTGGPSGGCIPASKMDLIVDYDSLKKAGSIMGSGGIIVMNDRADMVEVARFFIEFCKSESCGKCVPCRVGTTQLMHLLDRFINKTARQKDLTMLKSLCETVGRTSLCGLGQTAPNPVLSTLTYFENEYLAGIKEDA